MSCNKWNNLLKLCPISTGLALGLTIALASLVWAFWVIFTGPTPMMVQFNIPMPTVVDSLVKALWMLVKGFVFGVVFALIYDMIICCCKCWCCKSRACGCKTSCKCNCGAGCGCNCQVGGPDVKVVR